MEVYFISEVIFFLYNDVHPVQGPRTTQGRGLQSKRHHSKLGYNATKTQGVTISVRERI